MPVARKTSQSTQRARRSSASKKNSVQSLAKGFRVLEAFSADRDELTLSEVAGAAKLDAGTAFRMLNTLVDLGYVARVGESRRFRLTLKVLDLGFSAIAHKDQRAIVGPVLASLVNEVSEAASFGVLDGGDVLYIDRVRAGMVRLGVDIRVGTTIPAAISAIGRAILAFLPEEALAAALRTPARQRLDALRPDPARLLSEIRRVRDSGYVLQDSPFSNGLRVLAAPVLDRAGHAIGAVSVAAPVIRSSEQDFKARALSAVLSATKDIARALQASGSVSHCT